MKSTKMSTYIFRVFIIIPFSLIFSRYAFAQYLIPNSVFGNGGGAISGSGYLINGTLGQSVIGEMNSSSYNSYSGFWYVRSSSVTGIKDKGKIPLSFELMQNYPNPFNPSTIINYQLPISSKVVLKIYDLLGREVATLVNKQQSAGSYSVTFAAGNLASGIYFYQLIAGGFNQVKKLILLK